MNYIYHMYRLDIAIVWPSLLFPSHLTSFNNIHIPVKEVQLESVIQDIVIDLSSSFIIDTNKNEKKNNGYLWCEIFTSSPHSEVLGTPRKNIQPYHPGTFMFAAMQNLHILFIFRSVLKPDMLEGCFKEGILEIFHIIKWTSIEHWDIYKHQKIKQTLNRGYDVTELEIQIRFIRIHISYSI